MTKTKKENSEGKASNLAQLKHDYENIKTQLNELSTDTTKTQEDKETQAKALIQDATSKERALQEEIDKISKDGESTDINKQEAKDAQNYLNTANTEIQSLYNIICAKQDDSTTQNEKTEKMPALQDNSPIQASDGNIFSKTWNWIGDQWGDVRDEKKRKEEKGKNILRTAGFVATGVGAVALAYKGVKKLRNRAFGDDEEGGEEDDEKSKKKKKKSSRWKTGLTAVGIGIAGFLGYKNWDNIKEFGGNIRKQIKGWFEKEKPLELDEAVKSATSEVRNGKIKENPFRQHFEGGIIYNEGNSTIESYGESTKIDVKNKSIEGLNNIKFPNFEELVHAANIINFARRNFAGKCQSSEPFDISDGGGGDLIVHLANGEKPEWISASDSSLWTKILGTGGCVIGAALGAYIGGIKGAVGLGATLGLGGAVAGDYIDNNSSVGNTAGSVASGTNLKRFKICLNEQKDEKGNSLRPKKSTQKLNPDNYSPIEKEINEIIKEIEGSGGEGTGGRNLKSEQNRENPEVFTISSYGQKVEITLKGCTQTGNEHIDYSKITSIKIGKYRKHDRGDGLGIDFSHDKEGLKEAIRVINFTNFIRSNTDFAGNGGENYPFAYGKYKVPFALDMDTDGVLGKAVLSHNALKTKFPTIYEDVQKQFNKTDQENLRSQAFNNKNIEGYGSYYIRYLHQMRNEFDSQSYRINGQ